MGLARGREGGGVGVWVEGWLCQGAPSHDEGLALLADRWPVDLSLQFVLPGSPALFSYLPAATAERKRS